MIVSQGRGTERTRAEEERPLEENSNLDEVLVNMSVRENASMVADVSTAQRDKGVYTPPEYHLPTNGIPYAR